MNQPGRMQRFVERRWALAALASIIALASAFLLRITLERDYFEYWLFPKEKVSDGYSYPQLRYTIVDIILTLWCVVGLVASVMLISSRGIRGWTYRTLVVYFVLFGVLILGGILMMVARSQGY